MERIAIIDHDNHELFIEDIDEEVLEEKYDGEEEKYIKDNYTLENFSWDFITRIEYDPGDGNDPIEVEPADLL